MMTDIIPQVTIESKILTIRGKKVIERFPADFIYKLTTVEFQILRSQIGTSSWATNATCPLHSPNMAWQCFQAYSVIENFKKKMGFGLRE
jgi:hypothetical protein